MGSSLPAPYSLGAISTQSNPLSTHLKPHLNPHLLACSLSLLYSFGLYAVVMGMLQKPLEGTPLSPTVTHSLYTAAT
jgi:hypothetical protein